jgi:tRNA(Arg) A34 adenosine deaminase TadA
MDAMDIALLEARNAALRGEVPVGCVVLDGQGRVLASAGNRVEETPPPTPSCWRCGPPPPYWAARA